VDPDSNEIDLCKVAKGTAFKEQQRLLSWPTEIQIPSSLLLTLTKIVLMLGIQVFRPLMSQD
jgi:hypothetical protein